MRLLKPISGAVAWLWSDRATSYFVEHQVLGALFGLALLFSAVAVVVAVACTILVL